MDRANPLEIVPSGAPLGHEIRGVDLSAPLDPEVVRAISEAWARYGVVVMRGQNLSPARQVEVSRRFGALESFSIGAYNHPDHPEIFVVSNIVEDGRPIGMADAGRDWHTDMCFTPEPPRGSLFHAIEVPERDGEPLGDTLFASTAAAYDALPADVRRRIDGRMATFSFANRIAIAAREKALAERPRGDEDDSLLQTHLRAERAKALAKHPDLLHPLVRRHPLTGRKCLYISELHTTRIEGMEPAESDELLAYLNAHVIRPEFVYRHRYRPGDVVFWDNCACIHKAIGDFALPLRRRMHRTTIGTWQ